MPKLRLPVIDMHTHLRAEMVIPYHTKIAQESGIQTVVCMANTTPPLDNPETIKRFLSRRLVQPIHYDVRFVGAITKGLEGRELVDVESIKPLVVGFSDDGYCLTDTKILADILSMGVLVMLHCEPEIGWVERYLEIQRDARGRLHLQHISRARSVELIRTAKKDGIPVTCETCPHYFMWAGEELSTAVNPPLGAREDLRAIREGLQDGTIDVIASDYAPEPRPRGTGIAGFRTLIPLSYGLVIQDVLTEEQMSQKLSQNPKIILGI